MQICAALCSEAQSTCSAKVFPRLKQRPLQALAVADLVVVLTEGAVSFVGRPEEWAAQPGLRPASALSATGDSAPDDPARHFLALLTDNIGPQLSPVAKNSPRLPLERASSAPVRGVRSIGALSASDRWKSGSLSRPSRLPFSLDSAPKASRLDFSFDRFKPKRGLDNDVMSARQELDSDVGASERSETLPLMEEEARAVGSVRWAIYK